MKPAFVRLWSFSCDAPFNCWNAMELFKITRVQRHRGNLKKDLLAFMAISLLNSITKRTSVRRNRSWI